LLTRYKGNPILEPIETYWEKMQVRNPAAWFDGETVHMIYTARTVWNTIYLGYATSTDGYHFKRMSDKPWLSPSESGFDAGTVEDARMVKIGDTYYIVYMARATGKEDFEAGERPPEHLTASTWSKNWRRAGLLTTKDFKRIEHHGPLTSENIFNANVILFPEKINGKYCILHRPSDYFCSEAVCNEYPPEERPGMSICFSDDLKEWTDDQTLARPEQPWENFKIGGSSQPIKTDKGWLTLYHGCGGASPEESTYKVGIMMLDLENPTKVIARSPDPILEPEMEWEIDGPPDRVVFPNSAVLIDDTIFVYYGACDRVTAVATRKLTELVDYVMQFPK
jgi:beta-1,2-mannobiose phosphorylase / 1,2-beta-oligomannan phosphorylase